MNLSNSEIQELQKYLKILESIPNSMVKTSDIRENNFEPFINNILLFNYVTEKCALYDTFPVLICCGFTFNKRSGKIFLKGINLNYVSLQVRKDMTRLLTDLKKRIKVFQSNDGKKVGEEEFQYNSYELYKDRFKEVITSCYKTYDISSIQGLKIIPTHHWDLMTRFPIDTFVKILDK